MHPSHEESIVSHRVHLRDRKQHLLRPKIRYRLAHPPPKSFSKQVKGRPQLLLQVQQVSNTPRPTPIFDVLQSVSLGNHFLRMLPNLLRGKDSDGSSHIILLSSGSYALDTVDDQEPVSSENCSSKHQDVMATIRPACEQEVRQNGGAEIRLHHGLSWEATPLPNGSHNFAATDDGQLNTVRWVIHQKGSRHGISDDSSCSEFPLDGSKRFSFSVITPSARRHPVIASMTRTGIDVVDHYSLPTRTGTSSPTIASGTPTDNSDVESADHFEHGMITVDDGLRNLVLTTGIWVAIQEGWSEK